MWISKHGRFLIPSFYKWLLTMMMTNYKYKYIWLMSSPGLELVITYLNTCLATYRQLIMHPIIAFIRVR